MPKKNRIAKEWSDAAESWVDFVRQGKDYFRDELNTPGMLRLIGNVKGLRVLDIACGEGYHTRMLASMGAKIVGVDLSGEMIRHAKSQERKDHESIRYYVSDSANLLRFSTEHFDLVTCFMALMDIEDYETTICEVARVLRDRGRFIFSITHPCFEYVPKKTGKITTKTGYFRTRKERVHWDMDRLIKPFETTSFHRSLTEYSDALFKHELLTRRLLEPKPTKKGPEKFPALKEVFIRPHSLIFETIKVKQVTPT